MTTDYRICPRCKSKKVRFVDGVREITGNELYRCLKCGFTSQVFPEVHKNNMEE